MPVEEFLALKHAGPLLLVTGVRVPAFAEYDVFRSHKVGIFSLNPISE